MGQGVSSLEDRGYHGATPSVQRADADESEVTGLACANEHELRTAVVEKGLIKGRHNPGHTDLKVSRSESSRESRVRNLAIPQSDAWRFGSEI